jgi:multiple sugar transport system permease protein
MATLERTLVSQKRAAVATKRRRPRFSRVLLYAIVLIWAIIVYFPLYWMLITAFKLPIAINLGATYIPWVDFTPDLHAWVEMLTGIQSPRVFTAFRNGTLISITTAILSVALGSMAGFGLARFRYRWGPWRNNEIGFWFISQRMMPPVAIVLAFLIMYHFVNLLDNQFGLILAYTSFNVPLVIWIMRDYFLQLPVELEESALIDGASRLRSFVSITVPLAAPGLVTAFILSFIFTWNEYLFALILTFEQSVTVPLLLASQVTSIGVQYWKMAVLATMSIVPSIICAVALSRYIERGLFAGAFK